MYYKPLLPVLLLILFSVSIYAQDNTTVEEETEEPEENGAAVKRYKYEIGTDIKWIFLQTITNNYPNSAHTYSYNNSGMRLFGRINKSNAYPRNTGQESMHTDLDYG
jgi:hypothetical protein